MVFNCLAIITIFIELVWFINYIILFFVFCSKKDSVNITGMGGYIVPVAFVGGGVCTFLMFRTNFYGSFVFAVLIWICIFILMRCFRKIIIYDERGFSWERMPFVRQHFDYDEITAYYRRDFETVLCMGKGRRRINHLSAAEAEFLDYALWHYRRTHGENPPENEAVSQEDIFHGNVDNVRMMIGFYSFIIAVLVAGTIYFIYGLFDEVTESETEYFEIIFTDYRLKNGDLILKTEEGQYFVYRYMDKTEEVMQAVQNKQMLCLNAIYGRWNHAYSIYSVKDGNGKVYVTLDEMNKWHKENAQKGLPFALIIPIMALLWIIKSIRVTRNPEKYSRWARDLFYLNG